MCVSVDPHAIFPARRFCSSGSTLKLCRNVESSVFLPVRRVNVKERLALAISHLAVTDTSCSGQLQLTLQHYGIRYSPEGTLKAYQGALSSHRTPFADHPAATGMRGPNARMQAATPHSFLPSNV